ncbi:HD domain-containing phosphohydrolase [Bacillota bacterium Lsc_1132]
MKSVNWFTTFLGFSGLTALLYSFMYLQVNEKSIFFIMVAIIIILEVFPIKLPSGDDFEAGSIGFLFVLVHFGFSQAVLALTIGLIAAFIKIYRSIRIPLFRVIVNIGMYSFSLLAANFIWYMTQELNLILAVALTTFIYELVNLLLLEIIQKVIYNKELFTNIRQQLAELIVPIIVYSIVIPALLIQQTDKEIILTMLYTLFFLLIVIFFSRKYIQQLSLRKSTTTAFIQVLEERITSSLAGHGNRVGMICEAILDDLGYPKRKRPDLVQAAIIHDIGKALLSSHIFTKRGALTLSEEHEYRSHPEKAVEIVKTMFAKNSFSDWILYHHERWDGKGFPKGLKGEEIPYESRIIALANEVDHIFHRHDDPATILKLLKEQSGTTLDPKLVEKVELYHIEMILENIQRLSHVEEFPQKKSAVKDNYRAEDAYSSIGESFFIEVENGQVSTPNLPPAVIQSLVKNAAERKELVHDTVVYSNRTLDVYAQPFQNGKVGIFAHDLTPFIGYRKKLEQDMFELYVEVINTLSDGKILLHSSKESLADQLGGRLYEMSIYNKSDVPKSRELTKRAMEQFPTKISSMKVQIAVTEAATNILKHATRGKLSIYQKKSMLQFLISDKGSGIPLHEIPKTVLISGYSSKRSLGQGFKIITSFSDRVQIYTSSEGTSILIEYDQEEIKEEPSDAS